MALKQSIIAQDESRNLVQQGKLFLTFEERRGKTRLTEQLQHPPLRASQVLYIEEKSNHATIYLVETAGGMVAGDTHEYRFRAKEGSSITCIPQSALKIYPCSTSQNSQQSITIQMEKGSFLGWKPEAIIPYVASSFQGRTTIQMDSSAALLWGEIMAPGRKKSGETFKYTSFQQLFELWVEDECVIYDSIKIEPEKKTYTHLGALEEYEYIGVMWYVSPRAHKLDETDIYTQLLETEEGVSAVTKLDNKGLHMRWLSNDIVTLRKQMNDWWRILFDKEQENDR